MQLLIKFTLLIAFFFFLISMSRPVGSGDEQGPLSRGDQPAQAQGDPGWPGR
ncbi:MAG: hypothetical protein ACOY3Z_12465 [Thermodesulfobacteriota bacterium]